MSYFFIGTAVGAVLGFFIFISLIPIAGEMKIDTSDTLKDRYLIELNDLKILQLHRFVILKVDKNANLNSRD